jgi:ubiquinol-cytochrome c reductase cytochrome b subunit
MISFTILKTWLNERFPFTQTFHHALNYSVPINLNAWYIFGSLALFILCSQFLTGIWLVFFYTPSASAAFDSVQFIMRDVSYGWLIRYLHTTGASAFLLIIYLHMFRSLLYGSYKKPRELVWIVGVILFILILAEAFCGYLLPWGQMSFWGGNVITSAIEALPFFGKSLSLLVRGDFVVSDVTLHRFFALHIIVIPLLLIGFIVFHIKTLHHVGSNNPEGTENVKKIPFHPYYTVKDLLGIVTFLVVFLSVVFFYPDMGGYFLESANLKPADALVTPPHIQPMWYMAPFYAMLRAIPNKTAGVLISAAAVAFLFLLPWLDRNPMRSLRHRRWPSRVALIMFVMSFIGLGYLGTVELTPFRQYCAQGLTTIYFAFFLFMPVYSKK